MDYMNIKKDQNVTLVNSKTFMRINQQMRMQQTHVLESVTSSVFS